jgi:hypothetical protein
MFILQQCLNPNPYPNPNFLFGFGFGFGSSQNIRIISDSDSDPQHWYEHKGWSRSCLNQSFFALRLCLHQMMGLLAALAALPVQQYPILDYI